MSINQITNLSSSPVQQTSNVSKPATAADTGTSRAVVASSPGSTTDQASLSTASTLLIQALRTPDVRTEKVATLQASIAAGTYQVSSSDVADKLVESLLS